MRKPVYLMAAFFASVGVAMPLGAQIAAPDPAETGAANQAEPSDALQTRAADVVALMRGEKQAEDVFSPAFLAAVPSERFAGIAKQLTAQFGPVKSVESIAPRSQYSAAIALRFEKAIGSGDLALDPEEPHKIAGLLLKTFEPIGDTRDKILADIAALPGETSAYFGPLDGNAPIFSAHKDRRLAIGSTFKLYVLSALSAEIDAGKRNWSDIARLDHKSFPSGILQDWPSGSPLTLQTLATLMVSRSDNSATDQLIDILGRETIEHYQRLAGQGDPQAGLPLLKTREMFLLKAGPKERLAAYRSGNEAQRRAILAGIEQPAVTQDEVNAAFSGKPVALDVEWLASADELRRLLAHIAGQFDPIVRAIMAINPSLSAEQREQWSYVGYKGGSEPGVLNLSWLLTDKGGGDYALVMSWNDPSAALKASSFELIAQRILALPR